MNNTAPISDYVAIYMYVVVSFDLRLRHCGEKIQHFDAGQRDITAFIIRQRHHTALTSNFNETTSSQRLDIWHTSPPRLEGGRIRN